MKKLAVLFLLVFTIAVYAEDKWIEQFKILMTEQEKSDYKKLKSDSEKQSFVTEFWSKRDPSPGTPENEFKTSYENNFADINTRMKDKHGYETDMGQTLLLLGPPSEQKQGEAAQTAYEDEGDESSSGQMSPGKKTWIYKSLPSDIASGELRIDFIPTGGGWKFADKKVMTPILEKARAYTMSASGQAAANPAPQVPQQPAPMPPKSAGDQPPPVTSPEVKAALDATASGTPPGGVAVNGLVDSFMTSTGDIFSTIAVHSAGAAAGAKVGIRILDSTGKTVTETELPFVDPTATPPEAAGYFQSNLPIQAGDYSIALAVTSEGKAGGVKKAISVPDYGKFQMSSVILSKGHQQLGDAKPEKTPYTFGKIKVDPNVARVFSKADPLIIVYEAYNFGLDPSGQPNLEVSIGFQKGNEKPKFTAATPAKGLVTGKKVTIPTSFELKESLFTPGDWKVIVSLTDKISNQTAKQEVPFKIE